MTPEEAWPRQVRQTRRPVAEPWEGQGWENLCWTQSVITIGGGERRQNLCGRRRELCRWGTFVGGYLRLLNRRSIRVYRSLLGELFRGEVESRRQLFSATGKVLLSHYCCPSCSLS